MVYPWIQIYIPEKCASQLVHIARYARNYGYANTHIYRRNGYPSVKMGTPKIGYPGQSRVTIFIEISFHVNNIMVMEVLIFTVEMGIPL